MSTVNWDKVEDLFVGDTPTLQFGFLKENERDVRDFTNYSGWVKVWHSGNPPHVVRQGLIIAASGLVQYQCKGDELDVEGEVIFVARVMSPETSAGTGVGFFETSFPPVLRNCRRRPL